MSFLPQPATITAMAEQRHADLLAEAEQERRANLTRTGAGLGQPRADLSALRAVAIALAQVLAAFHRG